MITIIIILDGNDSIKKQQINMKYSKDTLLIAMTSVYATHKYYVLSTRNSLIHGE